MLAHGPRILLLLATLLILALTLTPVPGQGSSSISLDIVSFRGLADALVNVFLFVPFGAAAAACLTGKVRPVAAGAALSLAIELAQIFVPGRYVSPADLAFNTTGAAFGMLLLRSADSWLQPSGWLRRVLPGAAVGGALAALVGGSLMFAVAIPSAALYGQWTARFENMSRYEGEVQEAVVGRLAVPSRRIARSDSLRLALLRGDTVLVRATAGSPTTSLAPIFSIYDERAQEIFLFGADGRDAVLRFRMRATAAGLDQPEIRVSDAFEGVNVGDRLLIRVWAEGRGRCVETDARVSCDLGFTVGDTWSLILYPLPQTLMPWFSVAWMMVLLMPAGFATRTTVGVVAVTFVLAVTLLVTPPLAEILPTPTAQGVGAFAGLVAGHLCGRFIRARRASARARSARSDRTPDRRSHPPDRTGP